MIPRQPNDLRQPHDPLLRYRVLHFLSGRLQSLTNGPTGAHAGTIVQSTGCAPGGIHLALQRMESAGWVTSVPQGNRRYYSVTDSGLKALDEAREAIGA
ncbi:MAG: PadR family transcriptional regulator [Tepidiformaceae bacterium]